MKTLKFVILSIFCVIQLSLQGIQEDIRIPKIKQKYSETIRKSTPIADVITDIVLGYIDTEEVIKNQDDFLDALTSLNFEKMKTAVEKGADVNNSDNLYLSSPLTTIVKNSIYANPANPKNFESLLPFMEYLLNHGANINEQDNNQYLHTGYTILMYIIDKANNNVVLGKEESVKFVEFFLKKGANPDLIDQNGETALVMAARRGNYEVVKMLVDYYKANNSPTMLQQYKQAFDTEKKLVSKST